VNAENESPWLIDVSAGRLSRASLLADIARPDAARRICQPRDTAEALTEIARTLLHGGDMVLLDTDFSAPELSALGISMAAVNRLTPHVEMKPVSWDALQRAAAGVSTARLGIYTSGSTGLPKLVWQPATNLARGVKVSTRHAAAVWGFSYNPTHVAGIQVYLQALANGCPLVNLYGLGRAAIWQAIGVYGVTHLSATPSFYRLLLPAESAAVSVRTVTLGGESLDRGLIERLRAAFPAARIHNIYASTEAGTLLIADGDVFAIAAGLEDRVRIIDGRIHVHHSLLGQFSRGRQAADVGGLAGKPESPVTSEQLSEKRFNSQLLTTRIQEPITASSQSADIWYDTGDVVEVVSDAPLRFRIVARDRDWVNVGGSKVNPREVEAVLEEFPGIVRVRVSGRRNSVLGSILVAEVQCRDVPPSETQLREFAAARLQDFKVPRLIRFVNTIAQTRSGKTSRQ